VNGVGLTFVNKSDICEQGGVTFVNKGDMCERHGVDICEQK